MTSKLTPISTALALLTVLSVPALTHAAAVATSREIDLPRICRKGPATGTACLGEADCFGHPCAVDLVPKSSFSGYLTLIVDDDVSQFDGSETVPNVVAVTFVFDVRKNGRQLHAQTYQNIAGDTFETLVESLQLGPEVASNVGLDRRLDEAALNAEAADPAELLDAFLFQEGDSELADALRAQVGVLGTPFIVDVDRPEHTDGGADGRASVVRVRVQGKFLAP